MARSFLRHLWYPSSPGSGGNPIFASWIGHSSKQSVLEQANDLPRFPPLFTLPLHPPSVQVARFLFEHRSNLFNGYLTGWLREFPGRFGDCRRKFRWCVARCPRELSPTSYVNDRIISTVVFMHPGSVCMYVYTQACRPLLNIQAGVQISRGRLKIDISMYRSLMSL